MTQARPHIAAMGAYAMADLSAPPGKRLISLSQNESLRSPSPLAIQAATDSVSTGADYPDPDWSALRRALADLHGIPVDGILCGNGSLDLIGCITRAFAGPGREVVIPTHAYPFFRSATAMTGAKIVLAPEDGITASVDALLDRAGPKTSLVFLANPGNPTGTYLPKSEVLRLRAGLPEGTLLVLDQAYGEFADHLDEPCFEMVKTGNTVILRTFSKAYGMAGFRVGWGIFPPAIAAELRKVMNPNNIATASQAAAVAALADQDYMAETCRMTAEIREMAAARLAKMGLRSQPSHTNFLLIEFDSAAIAAKVDQALRAEGLFLRGQSGVGLPHMLRMTIGPEPDVAAALTLLERESLT